MIVGQTFSSASSLEQLVFQISRKRKNVNWHANSMIFYIVCVILYYQTIKLGIQSKLYKQNYSQMILEI